MQIKLINCPKTIEKNVKSLIDFTIPILLDKKKYKNYTIHIDFGKKNISANILGDVLLIENQKKFIMNISLNDKFVTNINIYETIVHELVHVKQLILGELTIDNKWFGSWQPFLNVYKSNRMNYWIKPSEIEANGLGINLFRWWMEKNKLKISKLPPLK